MFRGRIRLEGAYHGLHAAWLSIEVPFYIIADTKHTSNSTVLSFCNAHDHIGEERSLVRSTPLDERMSNLLPDGPILPILNVSTRSLRAYQRALRAFFAASILRGRWTTASQKMDRVPCSWRPDLAPRHPTRIVLDEFEASARAFGIAPGASWPPAHSSITIEVLVRVPLSAGSCRAVPA